MRTARTFTTLLCLSLSINILPSQADPRNGPGAIISGTGPGSAKASPVIPLWWKEGVYADQLVEAEQAQAALKFYKDSLNDAKTAHEPARIVLALTEYFGNAQRLVGKLGDARATYLDGIALAQKEGFHGWQATFLKDQGETERSMFIRGELSKVNPAPLLKSLELKPGDPSTPTDFRAVCYQCLGDIYRSNDDFDNCEKYLKLALAECKQLGDENYRIADLTCSLSLLRLHQGNLEQSIQLLMEACKMHPSFTREYANRYIKTAGKKNAKVQQIRTATLQFFAARKFSELSKYADKLRAAKETSPSGNQLINNYYAALGIGGMTENQCVTRIADLKEWIQQEPNSPTPKLLLSEILLDYAWRARGSGWSNTVTKEGWSLMQSRVAQAWSLLQQVNPKPSDWYPVACRVALGESLPKDQYNAMVSESQQRFPNSDEVLFEKAYFLQPKWHGDRGEAEKFIASELKKRIPLEADVFYARMIWSLNPRISDPTQSSEFDWPRMKRGLQEIVKRYPDSDTAKAALLAYALRLNDKETLQSFGAKNQ